MAGDDAFVRWFAKVQRHWVAPGSAAALMRQYFETDLRQVLPAIRVPTLVLAREWKHADEVEHVASQIPGAEFASLPGETRCRGWETRSR
jgi:hypothetical protein